MRWKTILEVKHMDLRCHLWCALLPIYGARSSFTWVCTHEGYKRVECRWQGYSLGSDSTKNEARLGCKSEESCCSYFMINVPL